MTRLRAFVSFLYDFVIGDDPLKAVAVTIALGVTAALAGESIQAWWLAPVAVVLVLGDSVRRATSR